MREGPHAEKPHSPTGSHTHTLTVLGWLFRRFTLLRHFSEQRVNGKGRKQNKKNQIVESETAANRKRQ